MEPETIWSKSEAVDDPNNDDADANANANENAKQTAAGFKTTGLDDDGGYAKTKASSAAAAAASQTVSAWRKAVATLVSSNSMPGDEDNDSTARALDIQELLDEIQETIDEAERSQEGVLQAARIRVRAQNAVAALGDASGAAEVANRDGSTTTIGFGAAAASLSAKATVTASTSSSAGATAITELAGSDATVPAAKPMMVVKRKKKRKDAGVDSEGGDLLNKPAVDDNDGDSNKRTKTE